jgi:hypothetical protein
VPISIFVFNENDVYIYSCPTLNANNDPSFDDARPFPAFVILDVHVSPESPDIYILSELHINI